MNVYVWDYVHGCASMSEWARVNVFGADFSRYILAHTGVANCVVEILKPLL